jgi:cell division protease FtsH
MSRALGPLAYLDGRGPDAMPRPSHSEELARTIDAEVRRLVEEASGRARTVLEASRTELGHLAEALLERETLSAQELEHIAGTLPGLPAAARCNGAHLITRTLRQAQASNAGYLPATSIAPVMLTDP